MHYGGIDPLMSQEGSLKSSPFIIKKRGRKLTKVIFKGEMRTIERI
jgi:hypothetical protein